MKSQVAQALDAELITRAVARTVGDRLGVDWRDVDLGEFTQGLGVELEHGLVDPQTNITDDDLWMTGKIAWAHLKELPDYYTRLARMESL